MYKDISELLMEYPYPVISFAIMDGWSKAWAMFHGKYQRILCDVPLINPECVIVKDICQKCDTLGRIEYSRTVGIQYDLVIGIERNTNSPYTECAGDGKYRPIFWYEQNDIECYKNAVLGGSCL